jgi:ribosomal protein L11 methyltransferase
LRWKEFKLKTTTVATDIVISSLYDLGVEGVQIEDNIPITKDDLGEMFVDVGPAETIDDGIAYLIFYMEDNADTEEIIKNVKIELENLRNIIDIGDGSITESYTEDVDWINNWKEFFHQFTIDDMLILPSWEEIKEENKGKEVIHIDPGTAFGTGGHETTRLAIRAIRKYLKTDDVILDIGCGSGILGIVAIKNGAKYVLGTDLDECTIPAVEYNMKENNISKDKYEIILDNVVNNQSLNDKIGYDKYDIVVSNILAEALVDITKEVMPHLKKDGIYITSGILEGKEPLVINACKENGLQVIDITHEGEWSSVVAKK